MNPDRKRLRILFITPWYPTSTDPCRGSLCMNFVDPLLTSFLAEATVSGDELAGEEARAGMRECLHLLGRLAAKNQQLKALQSKP